MDFKTELKKIKISIDKELSAYFEKAIKQAKVEDQLIAEALCQTRKIALSGGKRMRGALLYAAYEGVGGKEKKKALKSACAIELIHLFLLVHDDIIDRGTLRHGEETLNVYFKKSKLAKSDSDHFANSMAILVGELLYVHAIKILIQAGFSEKVLVKALAKIQDVISTTIIGQSQDVVIGYGKKISEQQVLRMCKNKTARYSFEGPLRIGALLGGCNDKNIFKSFTDFSLYVGTAFQIQDDILGVFGKQDSTGKSTKTDIEEGKKSLLVVKAYEKANPSQKLTLDGIIGKSSISIKEEKIVKRIMRETGALDYASNLADDKFLKSKKYIVKLSIRKKTKEFLLNMVEYLENREV